MVGNIFVGSQEGIFSLDFLGLVVWPTEKQKSTEQTQKTLETYPTSVKLVIRISLENELWLLYK
jgi:hypothetical protein